LTGSEGRPAGPGTARIAVDLLGGDDAPAVVVDGALQACRADPELKLLLVGPRPAADEVLSALPERDRARVDVLVVDRGVAMSDAVHDGADPTTTIGAAVAAVGDRRADALVSAGASGAIVAAAVVGIGRVHHVRRPALTAILPGMNGPLVLLDVGAGMQVNPVDLVQHATLGAAYARLAAGVEHPRVGLLSVGAEPGKGDRLRRSTDAALRVQPPLIGSYVGPVEGHDVVLGGRADVVVTDGFTGNVLLKGIEAASAVAPGAHPPTAVTRAAVLLGVAGTVVVCHGAARGADVASGIALAARLVRDDVVARLVVRVPVPAQVAS
jgi:glycerol-3-phosphate acyltransferase PlsX